MNDGAAADRKTILNIASFQVLAMFRRGMFYSYLSIYLRFFLNLSVTETTLFATVPMILNVLFQTFVWGVVSDRYQKRRTLIIAGEASAAVGTFFVWLVHTLPASAHAAGYVIIAGLSAVEIFWSMSNVGWSALISDLYPEYERTAVQGKLASIGAVGSMIGVWIGGLAYDGLSRFYEGWGFEKGLLFFIASGAMLLSTIPMFFVPEGGIIASRASQRGEVAFLRGAGRWSSCSRKFLLFLLAMVLINFGRNAVTVVKSQYLVLDEGFDTSSRMLAHIVNMQAIAIFLGGVFMGKVSRRFADSTVLILSTLVAALSLLGFALADKLSMIFASNFLVGLSEVAIMASSYSYASRLIPPEQRGTQFAMFNATLFLSWGVAATLIIGPVVDLLVRSGATQVFSYRMAFVSSTVLVLAGAIVFALVDRMSE